MASRLDYLAMYGVGYVWDNLLVPTADVPKMVVCFLNSNMHRQTLSVKIQEVINEITFVYYLEKGST